jgi:hypothetical protein
MPLLPAAAAREIGDRAATRAPQLSPEWQLFDPGASPARIDGATDSDTPRESEILSSLLATQPTLQVAMHACHNLLQHHSKLLPVP